jgi:hypothetical protein
MHDPLLVTLRTWQRRTWAVAFNSAPQDAIALERDVDAQIIGTFGSLTETPASDAFDQFS